MASSSAKTYTASGSAPKTYNADGNARRNSAQKRVAGTVTQRQLNRSARMGNALVQGGRRRGASAVTSGR